MFEFLLAVFAAFIAGLLVVAIVAVVQHFRSPLLIGQHSIADHFPELDGKVSWVDEFQQYQYESDGYIVVRHGIFQRQVRSKIHPNHNVILMQKSGQ